jgi:RNA polymerase sigma factor (sigma-70 family)
MAVTLNTGPAAVPDDEELADAAAIGESLVQPERFAILYDRYAAALHRYAGRRVGDDVADDLVAATFLAAFRGRERYDLDRSSARPWLFGILTKELARRHRTEQARLRALARSWTEPPADGLADRVAADVTARAARGALAAALARLSADERGVLLLIAWADLSYEETAQALGIPLGTVRSRLSRARAKVRQALGDANPMNEERA